MCVYVVFLSLSSFDTDWIEWTLANSNEKNHNLNQIHLSKKGYQTRGIPKRNFFPITKKIEMKNFQFWTNIPLFIRTRSFHFLTSNPTGKNHKIMVSPYRAIKKLGEIFCSFLLLFSFPKNKAKQKKSNICLSSSTILGEGVVSGNIPFLISFHHSIALKFKNASIHRENLLIRVNQPTNEQSIPGISDSV